MIWMGSWGKCRYVNHYITLMVSWIYTARWKLCLFLGNILSHCIILSLVFVLLSCPWTPLHQSYSQKWWLEFFYTCAHTCSLLKINMDTCRVTIWGQDMGSVRYKSEMRQTASSLRYFTSHSYNNVKKGRFCFQSLGSFKWIIPSTCLPNDCMSALARFQHIITDSLWLRGSRASVFSNHSYCGLYC